MFGRHIEENPYVFNLVKRLNKRSKQLQALHYIDDIDTYLGIDITEYNDFIREINNRDSSCKEFYINEDDFFEPYYQLRAALKSLKQYKHDMSIYQKLSNSDFRRYTSLMSRLRTIESGSLKVSNLEKLQANNRYFFDESYFELYQARLSIQLFAKYIKQDLRPKMESKWSLSQVLMVILINPFSLWSIKGWRLLDQRVLFQKKLLKELKSVEALCDESLKLNTLQFQYRAQLVLVGASISLREKEALNKLFLDTSLQKHLLSAGIINFEDLTTLKSSWLNVFNKINKQFGEEKNTPCAQIEQVGYLKVKNASIDDFLDRMSAIFSSKASIEHFNLDFSIAEGCIKHLSSTFFSSSREDGKQFKFYKNIMLEIYYESKAYFSGLSRISLNLNQKKKLFLIFDQLVGFIQKNEKVLLKTTEGKLILDILKHIQQSIFGLQRHTKQTLVMESASFKVS